MSILYRSETSIRITVALIGFLAVFYAPWWVPFLCMTLLSLRYAAWEVLIIGLTLDLMWLPAGGFTLPISLIVAVILVWICAPLRNQFLGS